MQQLHVGKVPRSIGITLLCAYPALASALVYYTCSTLLCIAVALLLTCLALHWTCAALHLLCTALALKQLRQSPVGPALHSPALCCTAAPLLPAGLLKQHR